MSQNTVYLTRTADKSQKKFDKPLRLIIRDSLDRIAGAPETVGEYLSSPLTGIYSHHITYKGKEFRIAYQYVREQESVMILLIGPHENFYKRLQKLMYAS